MIVFFVTLVLRISLILSQQTYNLIFSDNTGELFEGPIRFWGLNIDLSNTHNCCNGTEIFTDNTAADQVCSFTNNGTTMIGSIANGVSFPSLITINAANPKESLFIAPFTQSNDNWGWLILAYTPNSNCSDATGVWLGDPAVIPSERWGIHYGCIDTKTNTLETISIYNDTYDISLNIEGSTEDIGGGIYDFKRQLLWYYVPNFAWDHTIIFQINTNGTNAKQFLIPNNIGSMPFTMCHYSVYYDIYACMCASMNWCYWDPNHQTSHFVKKIQSYPEIIGFALIDNGKNAVLIDDNKSVFAMDVMKADFKQIGTLNLPNDGLANCNPGAILLSFDG
eukprot:471883_1